MRLLERVKDILVQPKSEWKVIAKERETQVGLFKSYVLPMAALGPLASIIGLTVVGASLPMGNLRIGFLPALGSAITSFVMAVAGVYILALLIDALATTFASTKNPVNALKVAVYSATPGWLAGLLQLFPGALTMVAFLISLYGVYLLYLGLQALMGTPKERALAYAAVVLLLGFLFLLVSGAVRQAFIS